MDRLREVIGTTVVAEDFDTVAGLVIHELGRIPDEGDDVVAAGATWTVTRMEGQRVAELRVTPVDDASTVEGGAGDPDAAGATGGRP